MDAAGYSSEAKYKRQGVKYPPLSNPTCPAFQSIETSHQLLLDFMSSQENSEDYSTISCPDIASCPVPHITEQL
ncbi:hypothetical protein SAMN05421578_102186 [Paenibacillus macquariensis]|uniref:Uncharacterized protein n=1 Tax=Paenibacillus macquariensis TaxID=948756 RepID=A0ABY1JMV8_9BACL|nr:hypothetical protein SAMN05421578_102186 [Paenibacillus macquariensis]